MMKHANISLFVPHAGCPHQCSFCNQKTISGSVSPLTPEEVTAVLTKASLDETEPGSTEIAFFGGSFTAIERSYMISLLEAAYPFIENGRFCGIRISTRPDAIDEDVLAILKKYGVTSIELGAQSTDDGVLALNRRGHTREHIVNASLLIKQHGFSLGLQMMTGLPGDSFLKCVNTARDIISLRPDTVRIYPTVTLEGTMLAGMYKKGEYIPQTLDEAVSLCAVLLKMFYDENIKVIRLGLHSGGNVEEGYLAGPYHPAFGELCESRIFLDSALAYLKENYPQQGGSFEIQVSERSVSKMTGQRGCNKKTLAENGYNVTVRGEPELSGYGMRIIKK